MQKGKTSLLALFSKGKPLIYKSGEIIIRPDDSPSGIFYIERGFVKVYSITQEGEEKGHIIYKEGETFPLMWALKRVQTDAYYEALGKVFIRRVLRDNFLNFIKTNPQVLLEVTDLLVSQFRFFVDRLENLEITKAYPRLVGMILFLAKRFGKKRGNRVLIEIPIGHKDIANSINMTRETASRELEKLKRKGLIEYKSHLIAIKNLKTLEEELEEHYEAEPL